MSISDREFRPRAPVVPSQLSAQHLTEKWLAENDFSTMRDADGIAWTCELVGREVPDPGNPYGLIWELAIVLKADIAIPRLVESGTLDPVADERMIALLGPQPIPFVMRPRVFVGKTDEEVRKQVIDGLPILRRDLENCARSKENFLGAGSMRDVGFPRGAEMLKSRSAQQSALQLPVAPIGKIS
jgi:hypothetical protein